MKMKRILLLLLLFFGLATTLKAEGDDAPDNNGSNQGIIKKQKPGDPHKAKAPSRVMILFSYDCAAETAHFDLPADIEYIDILLQDCESGFTFAGYASTTEPEWHQPLTAGEYYIECTADNDDIYAGYINIYR